MIYAPTLGPFEAITIMFIGLKITDNIDWSWWLVIGPSFIPPIIFIFGMSIAALQSYLK